MLFLVPTPIGNLRDITLRALDVLKAADLILCEDTRRTQKLLNAYEITKPLQSFHEHTSDAKQDAILARLKQDENIALVSDAGMPLISDPGFELVHEVILNSIPMEVLPGASAGLTALVASGLAVDSFSYAGFLPQKSASRKKELLKLESREETLVFYESPYRLAQVLEDMLDVLGDREAAVAREMTKKFEEVTRAPLSVLLKKYADKKVLGEIVIVVSGKGRKALFSDKR
jgi:16S rRNA (cytidine1402-2'-O)-methyltransferase